MHQNHRRDTAVTVHRGVSERPPVNVRETPATGRATRGPGSLAPTLEDQVRNLRMELSDLKIQVSEIAAHRT